MPELTPYMGPTKLILAFDIGTTYSSVSYCILEPHQVPEVLAVAKQVIHCFYRSLLTRLSFPAQGVARADAKVPSLLYYDKTGALRAAGAEVLCEDVMETALAEGWAKAEWWKLHLAPKHLVASICLQDDLPQLPPGKTAIDVLTDFTKYLFDCCKAYIQKNHFPLSWPSMEHSIEYIITYPEGWGDQKYLYFWAMERAGLVPSVPEGQCRVHVLTEGEADLYFCISHLLDGVTNEIAYQGVSVIDAGGGIINLSMFSVTSNPVSYEEIAPAESRLEGSVFVTCRARAMIEGKLEGWEYSSAKDIARFTHEFDQTTKQVIDNDEEAVYIRVADRRTNNSRHCISSGRLKLSGAEATGVFNGCVDTIIDTFERQRNSAATPITTVFFVGGLSTNEWVWSRLKSYFTTRNIKIYRPKNHTNKVVSKGAALAHINLDSPIGATRVVHGIGCTSSIKGPAKKRVRRATLGIFHSNDQISEVVTDRVLSHDPLITAYNSIERNLWRTKAEKADLEMTVESLHGRITHLEQEAAELRAVLSAHRRKHECEVLYAEGRLKDATDAFIDIVNTENVAVRSDKLIVDWISERLGKLGDDAMGSRKYTEATDYFSKMLSFCPRDRVSIIIKRSKARALMNLWEEALSDANEAIELDPTNYRGYEMKHAALRGARCHAEAVEAIKDMLSRIEESPDADVRRLHLPYVDARTTISRIVNDTIRNIPRILIDTITGRVYNRQQQIDAFEAFSIYSELLSSMTAHPDPTRVAQGAVKQFYQYAMFSHKWEDCEPLFQQVEDISVYCLEESSGNTKLKKFCILVRELGFRWAWTDSTCVDKSNNVILQESLVAMFTWYRGSSLTVVYLRGVLSKLQKPGGLRKSIWNTRAWTYQEYVAAEVVQFYTEDWKPYLGLTLFNHKESPVIISEMQQATDVSMEMIVLFPGLDRAREKLCLASRRESTLPEDIAYSLFGIFNVAMPVIYGEGNRAVGRLLEYILNGSGDATILAWTGSVGGYNSCLPKDLTVYDPLMPLHIPLPIEKVEMDRILTGLRLSLVDLSLVHMLYHQLRDLPSPSLTGNRLRLPSVVFPLTELAHSSESDVTQRRLYHATTPMFGDVEINTTDNLTEMVELYLVHPWIRPLLDQEFFDGAAALDETTQALRFVARLRQPFGALLFVRLGRVEYKRVAADDLVMVQIREDVPLTQLIGNVRTIEVC